MKKLVTVVRSKKFLVSLTVGLIAAGLTSMAVKKTPEIEAFVEDHFED